MASGLIHEHARFIGEICNAKNTYFLLLITKIYSKSGMLKKTYFFRVYNQFRKYFINYLQIENNV